MSNTGAKYGPKNDADMPVIPINLFRRPIDRQDLQEMGVHLPDAGWIAAMDAAIAKAAEPEQTIRRQLADDDAALWADLHTQFKPLFDELEQARAALGEAELAEAEAADALQVHAERRPKNDPKQVERWALRRSELTEVHSAYADVVDERRREFNNVAARLSGELWKSLVQRLGLTEHGIAEAERQAVVLRRQADELVEKAKRKHAAAQRLHSRLVADGTSVFEPED